MAESYGKFIQAIDNFETYSQDIITQCADFMHLATTIGSKVGSGVEYLANATSKELNKRDDVGFLAKAGVAAVGAVAKDAFTFAGAAIGEWRKNAKYKKATKKILADGLAYKETAFEMIPKSLEVCEIYLEACKSKVNKLKDELLKDTNKSDETIKKEAEELHSCIQKFYQVEYRYELANNIIKYFEEFENRLEDLEQFAEWYEDNILIDKIECYKTSYQNVYSLISGNDETNKNTINKYFEIVTAMSPVLALESCEGVYGVWYEAKNAVIAYHKGQNANGSMPKFYYDLEGFKALFEIMKEHFEGTVIPHYTKNTVLLLTIPSIVLTAIYSVLYFTGLFSFSRILPFSIPKYSDIYGLFIIIELIFLLVVIFKRNKLYKSAYLKCEQINSSDFINNISEIAFIKADEEKNMDEENLEKILLGSSEEPQLISETGESISEEDLLASIQNS